MIGHAIVTLSYDPNKEYSFRLTVWIREKTAQNLQGMDYCHNQVFRIHFKLFGIEVRQLP